MLSIHIKILDVSTEVNTDQNLSFDAIDSIVNRAVQSTLQAYLSLPIEDRLAPYRVNLQFEDDEEEE
jgi:hypothetical protein